ncbi:t-SNARE [Delitschia confertaspora ATCC 74209]|uniref:t-SNARE n=1 Tax=Delitschia confertaspora ATCC 74209 TaxID=1513339 RepID=A0A9P4MX37_9PLEO|nr:t-SNARE [Delitschia confertaspora ATCC 74209]
MSYSGYQQYSGNPWDQQESGTAGYGASNPYGRTNASTVTTGYGGSNPYGRSTELSGYESSTSYGAGDSQLNAPAPLSHEPSNYSEASQYGMLDGPRPTQHQARAPMSREDFLQRIDGVKGRMNHLTSNISQIATIHQRILGSPDSNTSAQLESIITQTQIQNTQIKDEIKALETDAARDPSNQLKSSQVANLKRTFREQLQDYEREEQDYRQRYREAIARQYRIVNPEATDEEVHEAQNADWEDEGIFQTALKTNRSATANSVLGAVRARHNDIQRIERTLAELALLFQQLNEAVTVQEDQVRKVDSDAGRVVQDTQKVNENLTEAIKSARRRQKLKWWTLGVVVAICCIIALILGLYFGLQNKNKK